MPPPNFYYHRQQTAPPEPRFGRFGDWLKGLLGLAILGGGGWAFYHFYWTQRLTEEHTLTDRQGKIVRARLEGRTEGLLKYYSLDNNTTNLVPITELSEDDQSYVRQLPSGLALDYPINCVLTDPAGQPMPVSIIRRSGDWIKYALTSDHSLHFAAISTLPAHDQELVRQFPPMRSDRYPVEYILPDPAGQPEDVSIMGRNIAYVEYVTPSNNQTHFAPISSLADTDQSFVRQLQDYLPAPYPFETTMTEHDGHKLHGVIDGRSNAVVKMTLIGEEKPRFYPLLNFALEDQKILQLLPQSMADPQFPLEMMLSDQSGKAVPARVIRRSDTLVQFISLTDNNMHLYPLSMLSATDQAVLEIGQSSIMRFPLESTLVIDKGAALKVRIEGHTADSVVFTTLQDNVKHTYPLTQISALDRTILQMVPTTEPGAGDTQAVKDLRDRIANLNLEIDDLKQQINRLTPNDGSRQSMQRRITQDQDEIESLSYEVNLDTGKAH